VQRIVHKKSPESIYFVVLTTFNYRGGFCDRAEYLTNFPRLATSVYNSQDLLGTYTWI